MNIKQIDYEGNDKLEAGKKWLLQKQKKPLFLTGETSSGKTTFIRTLLKEYIICEDDVTELNENLNRKSFAKIACVVECLESLHINDIEIVNKISQKKYSMPIIFTADDAYDKNFKSLRNNCEWILLKRPTNASNIIQKIFDNNFVDEDINVFLEFSNNNISQAISALTFYSKTSYEDESALDDIDIAKIDYEKNKFEETERLCQGFVEEKHSNDIDEDILFMLHENASSHAQNIMSSSKINDILSATDISEDDYLLRYGIAKNIKSFKKMKLRFPSYYAFLSKTKNKKTLKKIYDYDTIYNNALTLDQIYNEHEFKLSNQ